MAAIALINNEKTLVNIMEITVSYAEALSSKDLKSANKSCLEMQTVLDQWNTDLQKQGDHHEKLQFDFLEERRLLEQQIPAIEKDIKNLEGDEKKGELELSNLQDKEKQVEREISSKEDEIKRAEKAEEQSRKARDVNVGTAIGVSTGAGILGIVGTAALVSNPFTGIPAVVAIGTGSIVGMVKGAQSAHESGNNNIQRAKDLQSNLRREKSQKEQELRDTRRRLDKCKDNLNSLKLKIKNIQSKLNDCEQDLEKNKECRKIAADLQAIFKQYWLPVYHEMNTSTTILQEILNVVGNALKIRKPTWTNLTLASMDFMVKKEFLDGFLELPQISSQTKHRIGELQKKSLQLSQKMNAIEFDNKGLKAETTSRDVWLTGFMMTGVMFVVFLILSFVINFFDNNVISIFVIVVITSLFYVLAMKK